MNEGRALRWVLVGLGIMCALAVAAGFLTPSCVRAQSATWPLSWTAPGDDGASGTVSLYRMSWSSTTPDTTGLTTWIGAGAPADSAHSPLGIWKWINQVANTGPGPTPLPAGSAQNYSIAYSFLGGVKYWAMVTACDEAGNCARSNFATRITQTVDVAPPRGITDLRTGP